MIKIFFHISQINNPATPNNAKPAVNFAADDDLVHSFVLSPL